MGEVTKKDLALAEKTLHDIQMDCMEKASDHELTVKGRKEELAALAKAKKIVQEATSLNQLPSAALLQLTATSSSRAQAAGAQVVGLIQRLSRQEHSRSLAQLASRVQAAMRYHARTGEDPFKKIKG